MQVRKWRRQQRVVQPVLLAGLAAGVLQPAGGCSAPMPVRAVRYDIHVNLEPASHMLRGQSALHLRRVADTTPPGGPVVVEFELNPALEVLTVDCDSAIVKAHATRRKKIEKSQDDEAPRLTVHRVTLDGPVDDFTLTVNYEGELYQDSSAGEKRGQIHNFAMAAHVGTNGIYLSDSGGWYPVPVLPEHTAPEHTLADYALVVDHVEGVEFVAALDPHAGSAGDGAHSWTSARPLTGLALTGGDRVRLSAEHDGIRFHAVVSPGKAEIGDDMLECATQCYARYVPLVGPYPFREFTMLESFFSSGFAFPGFTQFTPVLINAKKPYWRHGYLDHEFLHNWFGNGVYVDPDDGNWCEALTSYCANLYGYELDGDAAAAREQRRNKCHFLSRIKPEKDKPLGTFGQEDGAGRSIGYDKGCMVFHVLSFTIGHDAFWAGVRRLTDEHMGKFADWDDLKTCFAAETDEDLEVFFEQWVRTGGTPQLEIRSATHDPIDGALELVITQGVTDFSLEVPIRIYDSEREYRDVLVPVTSTDEVVRLPAATAPAFVELDPDYHVFRKVPVSQIFPTSGLTRYGKKLVIIQPDGDVWENYRLVASDFEEGNGADNTTTMNAADLTAETLQQDAGVLVLGAAVRNPLVRDLLSRAGCPVSWGETGFRIGETTYDQSGLAVFVTVRHPDHAKRGITVYYGNDESALANAGILGFYANSLLVFDSAGGSPAGTDLGKSGGTRVVYRDDLEPRARVRVVRR